MNDSLIPLREIASALKITEKAVAIKGHCSCVQDFREMACNKKK